MKGIDRGPLDIGVVGIDPRPQQFPHAGGAGCRLGVLAGMHGDFPPAAFSCAADIGCRPFRIAVLDAVVPEIGSVALQEHIDDEPAFMESQIIKACTDEAAHD